MSIKKCFVTISILLTLGHTVFSTTTGTEVAINLIDSNKFDDLNPFPDFSGVVESSLLLLATIVVAFTIVIIAIAFSIWWSLNQVGEKD
jgi:hypothetical protein